ncbi:hypothetical protein Q428_09560 [Fervidicella metallireducens AeB]|uniref:Sporulation protein YqfD n=1 Tax=Fervidicella metallireducens AeB TaxID=1403537 RepID=A0A017RTZ5_9CLOT|nr:hypothetical protein Q428_09560 [Fervidicella metallireducens AeB]
MGVKGIESYFRGYIVVRIEGLNPEKLLNLASKNGIMLSDIRKVNFTTLEFKMRYSQYRGLKKIAKLSHCRVKIVKKYGFVFQMHKLKTRSFFIFGVIVFLFILFLLSSIIWSIEIDGNKKISSDKIYQSLENAGIKKGRMKYNLKLREVENALQNEIKEISVVNIKVVGTKIKVNIVERTMPPEIIKNTPSNVIAGKEGIITKILSYKGQPEVKIGDYVKKIRY